MKDTYGYYSKESTYEIDVEAQGDVAYIIKASKINVSKRIFEGIPTFVDVQPNNYTIIEFSNTGLSFNDDAGRPTLNFLIETVWTY